MKKLMMVLMVVPVLLLFGCAVSQQAYFPNVNQAAPANIVEIFTSNPKLYNEDASSWTINGRKFMKDRSINAADFGLTSGTDTDQAANMNRAIAYAANNAGIDTVFVPAGTYYIGTYFSFAPAVNVIGAGAGKTIFNCPDYKEQMGQIGIRDFENYMTITDEKDFKNIVIANMTLSKQSRVIYMYKCKNANFFNLAVNEGLIRFEHCENMTLEHNIFSGNYGKAAYAGNVGRYIRFFANRFNGIVQGSINYSRHENSYAGYNYITAPDILNTGYAGIRLPNDAHWNIVENNYIENHGRGIFVLSRSSNNIVRGNVINKTKSQGFFIQSPNNVFDGNVIIDAGDEAVYIAGGSAKSKSDGLNNRFLRNVIYDTKEHDKERHVALSIATPSNIIKANTVSTKFGRTFKKINKDSVDLRNKEIDCLPK